VSVANLLARTGERVLLIDMDVDAPGVTSLVGQPFPTIRQEGDDTPRTGLVSWALGDGADPELLIRHAAPVDGVHGDGALWILPAGQVDEHYAADIASLEWAALLLPASGDERRSPLAIQLAEGLAAMSRQMGEDAPSVVLIDVRAGVGPLAGTLLLDLADSIVFFLTGDEDAMEIYRRVHSSATGEGMKVQPVLSRLPHYLPDAVSIVLERIERLLKDQRDSIVFLRGAPGWEASSEPSVPPRPRLGSPPSKINATYPDAVTDLAADHVKLLLRLLPEVARPSEDVDPEGAALFDPATLERTLSYKIFRLLDGRILNLDDREPNVSLRTVTINQMFNGIFDEMVTAVPSVRPGVIEEAFRRVGSALSEQLLELALGPDGTAGVLVQEAFRASGRTAGSQFAESWASQDGGAPESEPRVGPGQRVADWCVFDSTVGFGHFTSTEHPDGSIGVRVRQPFMRGGGGGGFVFEGYVLTVMKQLLEGRYMIEVGWEADGDLVATATPREA